MNYLKIRELAKAYFPGEKPKTAQQKFAKWLRIEPLRRKLELLGWHPYQKILTPKQVSCIFDHVGEPDEKYFNINIKKILVMYVNKLINVAAFSVYEDATAKCRSDFFNYNKLFLEIKEKPELKEKTNKVRSLYAQYKQAKEETKKLLGGEGCQLKKAEAIRREKHLETQVKKTKESLPVITVHATFEEGRKDKDPHEYTGLILTDLDHLLDGEIERLMPQIKQLPFVTFAYRSVRGEGIHILSRIEVAGGITDENFKNLFKATTRIIECALKAEADKSVGSISRCMFLNHDPEIYYNPNAIPLNMDAALWLKENIN